MTHYFCQLLGVSRSGYYNYLKSSDKRLARNKADEQAAALNKKAFNRKGFKKGSRRSVYGYQFTASLPFLVRHECLVRSTIDKRRESNPLFD